MRKLSYKEISLGVILGIIIIFLGSVGYFLFSLEKVPVGYKGLKVYTFATSTKGQIEELGVGRYFIAPYRELYIFPTFSQNHKWEGYQTISFQSEDGLTLSAGIMIRYHFDNQKISLLFQKFRLGADEIRDTIVRNTVRDAINRVSVKYTAEEAFSIKKNLILDETLNIVKKELASYGIIIEALGFTGQITLPATVKEAIDRKIVSKQNAEAVKSQIESEKALAQAKIISAEADSKVNEIRQKSITNNILELKRLEIEQAKIDKWNGVLPTVQGNAIPLINLYSLKPSKVNNK